MMMLAHDLATALRQIWRYRKQSFFNLVSLLIGLGCFVIAQGADSIVSMRGVSHYFRNIDIIAEHISAKDKNMPIMPESTYLMAPALRSELPAGFAVARYTPPYSELFQRDSMLKGFRTAYADPDITKIFPLPNIPAQALSVPHSVVITKQTAKILFGDANPIGAKLIIDGMSATVTAIAEAPPSPSPFANYEALATWDLLLKMPSQDFMWYNYTNRTAVKLPDASSESSLDAIVGQFAARHVPPMENWAADFRAIHADQAMAMAMDYDATLGSYNSGISTELMLNLLGVVVLVMAAVNFVNIATAQVLARGREVRIRRHVGAGKGDLFRQIMVEYLMLIAMASAILAVVVAFCVPIARAWVGADLIDLIYEDSQFWLRIFLADLILLLLGGLYPALLYTGIATRPGPAAKRSFTWMRSALTCMQFAAAITLLIFVVVVSDENRKLQQNAVVSQGDQLAVLEGAGKFMTASLRDRLAAIPGVKMVSSAKFPPWTGLELTTLQRVDGRAHAATGLVASVGDHYFDVMDGRIIAGRDFAPGQTDQENDSDHPEQNKTGTPRIGGMIIDTTMVTQLGFARPQDAIGQEVKESGLAVNRIIGVVEMRPTTLMTNGYSGQIFKHPADGFSATLVRFPMALSATVMPQIDAAWTQAVADVPVKREFFSELFAHSYATPSACATITSILTLLAFCVALAGMAGMVMEHCRQHQRSVATRRILGASTDEMTRLLLWQLLKPLLIANLMAWPLAYAASKIYLEMFASRISLTLFPFLIGFAGSTALALLIVGQEAWRTAHANPMQILRAE